MVATDPALSGHVVTEAMPGATMSDVAVQVGSLSNPTDLVTIEAGTNDACGGDASAATFGSQFDAVLQTLAASQPRARIVVLSIFDLPAMWNAVEGVRAAASRRHYCLAATTTRGRTHFEGKLRAFNSQLGAQCARYPKCRYDRGAAYRIRWQRGDISTVDFFHPSVAGQRKIASALWATGLFK
jgi:lysophospholipase L1-like esterase